MRRFTVTMLAVLGLGGSAALADVFDTYEDLAEGFYGASMSRLGVTYRDVNTVSGFFPDGAPFDEDDLGNQLIVENAAVFYNDFPSYGSPVNSLTFGSAYVPGDNLSIGALASVWMDLDELSNAASLDIGFYENGPWGGIEYRLEAVLGGQVVASDSLVISDLGGRDNPTWATLSVAGAEFDSLHLYGWLNGSYTAPRGIIDDLNVTAVPEPASAMMLGLAALALWRRRTYRG